MPYPAHNAAARRDGKLLRIRKLTLWITGGAAAASLGLGTAFAHALPGHSYRTGSTASSSTSSSGQAGPPRGSTGTPATHHQTAGQPSASHRTSAHPRHQKLAPPAQAPKPASTTPPPAPVTSSGGS
jgi:hypothetical protein